MAKNQTGNATNDSKNLINQAQGLTAPVIQQFQNSLGTAQSNQGAQLGSSNNLINSLSSSASTGGYDPSQLASLRSDISSLGAYGGYDPTQLANINAGYGSFASTGGFTPKQEGQFIQQATEGTKDTYDILAQRAKQDRAATGGLGTGGDISQMARQLGQAQAGNTLNAEVALNQQENANKFSGLGGESAVASDVAAGKRAATGLGAGLESSVASGKLGGTEAAAGLSNQLFNTQTGQITALGNQILSGLGLDFGTQSEAINALTQLSKNPGMFQTGLGDFLAVRNSFGSSGLG